MYARKMRHFLGAMFVKIPDILSSIWGWLAALWLLVVEFLAGYKFLIAMVVFASLCDLIWGIIVAKRLGKYTRSELARDTLIKIAAYGNVLFIFIGIDHATNAELHLTTITVSVLILLVEVWSIAGNASIILPHNVFLRLFRSALRGEIARKMSVSAEEVDKVLNENTNCHDKK